MRGVARDGDRAAAGALQSLDAAQQPGQRIGRRRSAGRPSGPAPAGRTTARSGMWSWSRVAGVNCVSRTMNCALASGPMPPSTPSILSFALPWRSIGGILTHAQGRTYAVAMTRRIDLHGHRGARGLFPENTLAGFAGALAIGVDALELDVAMTADDVVVVTHDPRLNPDITRTGTAPGSPRLAPRSARCARRSWPATMSAASARAAPMRRSIPTRCRTTARTIPTLADVLRHRSASALQHRAEDASPGIPALPWMAPRWPMRWSRSPTRRARPSRIIVQSFDWRGPRRLRRTRPDIEPGLADQRARSWRARGPGGTARIPRTSAARSRAPSRRRAGPPGDPTTPT